MYGCFTTAFGLRARINVTTKCCAMDELEFVLVVCLGVNCIQRQSLRSFGIFTSLHLNVGCHFSHRWPLHFLLKRMATTCSQFYTHVNIVKIKCIYHKGS